MRPPDRPRGRWHRRAGYLNRLFNPLHGLNDAGICEPPSTRAATEPGLDLNLVYWQRVTSIEGAGEDLAHLLAGAVRTVPGDEVCGFGFGDEDVLWARSFYPKKSSGSTSPPRSW